MPRISKLAKYPSICPYCKAEIQWKETLEGKTLPINPKVDNRGMLAINSDGKLERANASTMFKFRSHLLDCKPMRDALYSRKRITLGPDSAYNCQHEGCEVPAVHFHCFKCGEIGHYANVCEAEDDVKELEIG